MALIRIQSSSCCEYKHAFCCTQNRLCHKTILNSRLPLRFAVHCDRLYILQIVNCLWNVNKMFLRSTILLIIIDSFGLRLVATSTCAILWRLFNCLRFICEFAYSKLNTRSYENESILKIKKKENQFWLISVPVWQSIRCLCVWFWLRKYAIYVRERACASAHFSHSLS